MVLACLGYVLASGPMPPAYACKVCRQFSHSMANCQSQVVIDMHKSSQIHISKPPYNLHKLHAFLLASCLDHRAGRLVATAQAVVSSLPLQNQVCEGNDGTDQKSKDHRNKTHQKRSGKASEGQSRRWARTRYAKCVNRRRHYRRSKRNMTYIYIILHTEYIYIYIQKYTEHTWMWIVQPLVGRCGLLCRFTMLSRPMEPRLINGPPRIAGPRR